MSGKVLNWAARATVEDVYEKAVLMVLAEASNDAGQTFISQATVADRCVMSKRKVVAVMAGLEARGHISRKRRSRENGHRSTDLITLSQSAQCAPGQDAQCAPDEAPLGARHDIDQVHTVHSITLTINPQIKDMSLAQPKSKSHNRIKTPNDTAFEALWLAYPHFPGRSIKRRAFAAWSAMSEADRSALVGAVCVFAGSPQAQKDGGQFVKGFHLWLKDGLWRDFVVQDQSVTNQSATDWEARLRRFKADGVWLTSWG
ncbi:hypothetical protein ABENE_23350, partial [Asticcacaulis benevestitus DSM 16100 = ATCC BAA-896]